MKHKRGRDAAFVADAELTRDDKKRLRRASKNSSKKEKNRLESEEKLAAKVNPVLGNKYEEKKDMEKLRRDKRVIDGSKLGNSDTKSYSKSSQFFSALQRQTEEEIVKKKNGKKTNSMKENSTPLPSSKVAKL